ncbi:MAG: hypothetical protein M1825_002807 [Sarcosagium campestre]|nr:MAG: hypothetical protein M1825_002807 [Sarcosagium campestre]
MFVETCYIGFTLWETVVLAAHHTADPFPHQTIKVSSDTHRKEGKAFTIHVYTDESGRYDRDREATWRDLKSYNRSDTEALESMEKASAIAEKATSSNAGSIAGHAADSSHSGNVSGPQATLGVQSWPNGWYNDPWGGIRLSWRSEKGRSNLKDAGLYVCETARSSKT